MQKAEKSAAAEKADQAKKRMASRPRPYPSAQRSAPVHYAQHSFRHSTQSSFRVEKRVCFQCQATGHVRANCPAMFKARRQTQQSCR